jgi:Lrp/AsnC family leucine-responsive transcriptional regulator
MDTTDLHIIEALQTNARTSNAELARELEMAPSAILERIRKLEQRGILTGYEARIAPRSVGLSLMAFVFVKAEEKPVTGSTGVALAKIPEVQEVHHVAGEDCYFVKVRVRDTDDLSRVLQKEISTIKSVKGTRTTIVLSTVKETAKLSLAEFSRSLGEASS